MSVQITELKQETGHRSGRFSSEDVEFFRQNGFVIVRNLADLALRRTMLEATLEWLACPTGPIEYEAEVSYPGSPASMDAEGGRTIRRLQQALSRHFAFTQWVSTPGLVCRLRQLLGTKVIMPLAHHNCIMTKQPRFSSDTGWHQDIRYWSFERPELISVWLALGREFPENGCLKLIPGSHLMEFEATLEDRDLTKQSIPPVPLAQTARIPDKPPAAARLDDKLFLRPEIPENRRLIDSSVYAELGPGDALFFHCRTYHAASRNRTNEPKLSAVFTFRPSDNLPIPGTRSASMPELILPDQVD